MTTLLLRGCDVLDIRGPREAAILPEHDVLIAGGRIESVQPSGAADPAAFDEVIDARGLLAMPGLINTHAHTPMVLFRGLAEDVPLDRWFNEYIWPLEKNLGEGDVYLGMTLGLAEMIRGGVTTVNEHYFQMHEAAQAVADAGTRGVLGWAIFGDGGQPMLERAIEFTTHWQGRADGRIRTLLAPHAPYTCPPDYLRLCADAAARLNLPIHIHAAENRAQTDSSLARSGRTPIEVLDDTGILQRPTIIAHACGATDADIALMAARRASVAHCPKTYLKLAMDVAPVVRLREAGVAVGLGSDGAVSNNTLNLWEALRLTALIQKDRTHSAEALPLAEALYLATRGGAEALGLGDQLGQMTPGFLADIVLVDLSGLHHQPLHNPAASLVYNTETADVRTVIVNGRVIMRDRRLLTIDEAEVLRQARETRSRLALRRVEDRIQTYAP